MNNEIPKYVTRARAAYLLGLPEQRGMVFYLRRASEDLRFCDPRGRVALEKIELPPAPPRTYPHPGSFTPSEPGIFLRTRISSLLKRFFKGFDIRAKRGDTEPLCT
jgi:hypothetical protein